MISFIWERLKEIVTLGSLPASALFVVGLFMLLIPASLANFLGINSLRDQYRSWISILTVIAGAIILCRVIRHLYTQFTRWKKRQKTLKQLSSLSNEEKLILYFCVSNNSTSAFSPQGNPFVQALCSRGFLIPSSGTGSILSWSYLIPQWVWEYLKRNSNSIFSDFRNLNQNDLQERVFKILKLPLT